MKIKIHTYLVIGFSIVCLMVALLDTRLERHLVIKYDTAGYYHYLPSLIIYKDIQKFDHLNSIVNKYHPAGNNPTFGLKPLGDDRWIIKYTCGMALSELPFFLVADIVAKNSKYNRDGYSLPYQISIIFSNLFYIALGLYLLGNYLSYYFRQEIVTLTLLMLAFGTNLFFYSAFDMGMSHGFLFFILSGILLTVKMFMANQDIKYLKIIAFLLGFAILVRPTSVLFTVVVFFYPGFYKSLVQSRLLNWKGVSALMILFFIPFTIQSFYWLYVTGSPVYYSYQNEGFNLLNPHVFKGLFSFQKGWFVYTPVAALGMIGVVRMLFSKQWRSHGVMLSAFYVPFMYLLFSWANWWYGGSFGSRVMVDTLALLAIPLAVLFRDVYIKPRVEWMRWATSLLLVIFVSLNLFQTYQYRHGIMHWDKMSKESYFYILGKTKLSKEERKKLYPNH